MKGKLLVLLAMCAFTIAMVPMHRDRRAVNTDEEEEHKKGHKEICDLQTTCAWSVYNPPLRLITLNVTNSYCDCAVGMVCEVYEDDTSVSAFVFRCRTPTTPPPNEDEETDESDS